MGAHRKSKEEMVQSEDRKNRNFWLPIACEIACLKKEQKTAIRKMGFLEITLANST